MLVVLKYPQLKKLIDQLPEVVLSNDKKIQERFLELAKDNPDKISASKEQMFFEIKVEGKEFNIGKYSICSDEFIAVIRSVTRTKELPLSDEDKESIEFSFKDSEYSSFVSKLNQFLSLNQSLKDAVSLSLDDV